MTAVVPDRRPDPSGGGQPRSLTASAAPSRSALAARSLAAVDRIADPEQRYRAFSEHMDRFPPTIGR